MHDTPDPAPPPTPVSADMDRVWMGLLDSEEKFLALVERSPLCLIIGQGIPPRIVYANQALASLLGRGIDELTQMDVHEVRALVHPEDQDRFFGEYTTRLEGGSTQERFQFRVLARDGSVRWTEVLPQLVSYLGKPAVAAAIVDQTQQVQARQALAASEEKYRALVDQSLQGIVILQGAPPQVGFVNERLARIIGMSVDELMGMGTEAFFSLIHPEDRALVLSRYSERVRGVETPPHYEARAFRPDGTMIWIETYASLTSFEGRPAVQGTILDVTARKQAQERLAEAENVNSMILASIRDGVYMTDDRGRFTYVNEVILSRSGRPRDWFEGRSFADLLPPSERDRVWANFEKVMAGEKVPPNEIHYPSASGDDVWVEVNTTPHRQGDRIVGVLGVSRDITERKKGEKERRQLEERVRQTQRLESLAVMAGGMAHDFNNLLMVVQGNAEMATQALSRQRPVQPFIDEISRAAQGAAQLCQQMLAYSGRGRLQVATVDLNRAVCEVRDVLVGTLSRRASLSFDLDDSIPAVTADATQVKQVIMNLLINASEAMGEASGTITVRTGHGHHDAADLARSFVPDELPGGEYVRLDVTDTGQGMSREILESIFDPFFTTKFTGRGLGLAASLGIVRGHGGAISVTSEPGEGSTFTILLPAHGEHVAASEPDEPDDGTYAGSGTVLVVDDDPKVRDVARQWLEQMGFEVLEAGNGSDAVAMFGERGSELALVILDLVMPGLDGVAALRRMRGIDPDVPAILSSGFNEPEAQLESIEGGRTCFLHKPYRPGDLARALSTVLGPAGFTKNPL